MSCIPDDVWENYTFWAAVVPLIHFSIVEYQCADRVLRQFNMVQSIPKPPIDYDYIHSQLTTEEEETYAITIWDSRFEWLPEDCTPIEDDDHNCCPEYSEWYNINGKPFLVAPQLSQQWSMEQRCSYDLVGQTSTPIQNPPQQAGNRIINPADWRSWRSQEEARRHVLGQSTSNDPWERAVYTQQIAGGTSYQHSGASSSGLSTMFEQPPDHFQSTFGQGMGADALTTWLSTTTISSPSFAPAMFSTPPPMQQLDYQGNEDEEASDHPHPRRAVRHPRRYDQTSSLHRQELPRRRR